jgi:hypothetical protein
VLTASGKLASVTRWDDLLNKPEFPAVLAQFKAAAQQSSVLHAAIAADVAMFVSRQPTPLPDASLRSAAYILEELAAITLHARGVAGARLYPSKNLQSFAVVEANLVPEAPWGLQNQQRIHLELKRRGATLV